MSDHAWRFGPGRPLPQTVVSDRTPTWRRWLAQWLHPVPIPLQLHDHAEGQWTTFDKAVADRFGMAAWCIRSKRGGFVVGYIEWSPQWRAYRYVPAVDLVFNAGLLVDIYAFLRERGNETGRFV